MQYYEGGWIGGHANWWWNVYINGKKLKLKDGTADFSELDLGRATDPPNLIVKSGKEKYLIRVLDNKPDIMLIPENMRGPYSWTSDGSGLVTRRAMLDIKSGEISPLPEFKGDFLGFSPDNKHIISIEFNGTMLLLRQTERITGEMRQNEYPIKEYKWLNNWTHFQKPHYAPNVWIFNNIRWNKNDKNEYDMFIPKDSEIGK